MGGVLKFNTISEYNAFNRNEDVHPLVSIIDLSKAAPRKLRRMYFGFYTIFLKQVKCGDLRYGLMNYDYQEGTLVFVAPGQVLGENNPNITYHPKGHALVFHPDFVHGTSLGNILNEYSFFSYAMNEALHLSKKEQQTVLDCFSKIKIELKQPEDKHSKKVIVTTIELFLNYCNRFYDRQFKTRDNAHKGVLEKFEEILNDYFVSDRPQQFGLPSVNFCAEQLHLSTNYFGDLIKKETGNTAQEYIQTKIVDIAKEKLFDKSKTISEVAYGLGFKYPQHFTRLFKQRVGCAPNKYRTHN